MQHTYAEASLLTLTIYPHPSAGPEEGATKTTELLKFEGRGGLPWTRALFPNCLAASDKHKKLSQMDTDLGGESRDFLTPRSTGLTDLQGEGFSSHPQNRMTSLACQLIRLCVGAAGWGPPRVYRHPLHQYWIVNLALCPRAG